MMTFIILENSYSNQGTFITSHDVCCSFYNRYDYSEINVIFSLYFDCICNIHLNFFGDHFLPLFASKAHDPEV